MSANTVVGGGLFDFWRSNSGVTLPDGAADTTETIARTGRVGIGNVQSNDPVAQLDLAVGGRSGTDRRNAADPLYATGAIAAVGVWAPDASWVGAAGAKAFIGHSNQTAGIAFGWNVIQQVGVLNGHDLIFALSAPLGQHARHWAGLHSSGGWAYSNEVLAATPPAAGQGFYRRWVAGNQEVARDLLVRSAPGAGLGWERSWAHRDQGGTYRTSMTHLPSPLSNAHRTSLNPSSLVDDALLILSGSHTASTGHFSIGIRSNRLSFFTGAVGRAHAFYGDTSRAIGQEIATFVDDGTRSRVRFPLGLPVFASDAAAGGGGLLAGELYQDGAGAVRVKL